MSDSIQKYFDDQWNENPPQQLKKINNSLTPLQACNIVNLLSLHTDDEELLKEAEILKEWIKSK